MKMFFQQCKVEMLRMLRNPYYLFWSLCMPVFFYILFTKVIDFGAEDSTLWKAHYLMSMTTFSIMGSSIVTMGVRLVEERSTGWTKFIQVTPLSTFNYFTAKMVGQTFVHVFSILVIFLVGFVVNQVSLSFAAWVFSGIWILLASLPFLALGLLIGLMKRVDTAIGISNVLYMSLAITGGMWMPIDILPSFIQKFAVWLPAYNFGSGAWQIVRGNVPEIQNILILICYIFLFVVLSIAIKRKQEAV